MKLLLGIALSVLLVSGCGYDDDDGYNDKPSPAESEFSKEISPLLVKSCAGANCHNAGFITSEAAFKNGKPGKKLYNGSMPKKGSKQAKEFSKDDKARLLEFLTK